jgi:hypothetical protein
MALSDENGMVMPVAPTGGGFGGFGGGDSWAWIILLFLFAGGGFGNGFGGGNNIYPWMNQADITTNGFQNAAINTAVSGVQNSITSGFGDVQTALCGGFAGVNASITNASINSMQNMNALQSQLAQCCCDNRLATVQTQNITQSEGAATRLAIQNQTQAILDRLCQQEIDNLKERNSELQTKVLMQNLAASQTAQTAQLIADNTAQTQYLVNRISPYPTPAYVVANPNTPAII